MNKKITIMHLCDKFGVAGSSIDGVTRLFSWWLPRFNKDKFKIVLCGMKKQDKGGKMLEDMGIDVVYLNKPKNDPTKLFTLLKLIKRFKPDILHLHCYAACTFGRIAGLLCHIPTIVHEHFADPYQPFSMKIMDGVLKRMTTHSIAVSASTKDFLVKGRKISEKKIDVIYNGVPLNEFRKAEQQAVVNLRNELNLAHDKVIVGTICRLDKEKGLHYFLHAARSVLKKAGNVIFIIVGDGPQKGELAALIEKLSLKDNVLLLGYRKDIPEILTLIDIFVIPSLWEGTPLTLFEAMAVGKPIVSTNVDGLGEILEDRKTALVVPPRNAEMLSSSILELLADKKLRGTLVLNTQEAVKQYDVNVAIRKLENLYTSINQRKLKRSRSQGLMSTPP